MQDTSDPRPHALTPAETVLAWTRIVADAAVLVPLLTIALYFCAWLSAWVQTANKPDVSLNPPAAGGPLVLQLLRFGNLSREFSIQATLLGIALSIGLVICSWISHSRRGLFDLLRIGVGLCACTVLIVWSKYDPAGILRWCGD